jgi:hypothetical protein
MPTLSATTTTIQTVALKPTLRRKLLVALQIYAELRDQETVLDLAKKKQRGIVQGVLEEVGETSLKLDGYTATIVAPAKKVLDRKKFVQLGGDLALLDAAYVEQDVTPYVKVTVPKEDE